jgi:hypothetical protein
MPSSPEPLFDAEARRRSVNHRISPPACVAAPEWPAYQPVAEVDLRRETGNSALTLNDLGAGGLAERTSATGAYASH